MKFDQYVCFAAKIWNVINEKESINHIDKILKYSFRNSTKVFEAKDEQRIKLVFFFSSHNKIIVRISLFKQLNTIANS